MKKFTAVRRTCFYQLGQLIKSTMLLVIFVIVWVLYTLWHTFSSKYVKKTYHRYRDNGGNFTWDYIAGVIRDYARIEEKVRVFNFELLDSSYRSFEKPKYPEPNHLEKIHNYYKELTK